MTAFLRKLIASMDPEIGLNKESIDYYTLIFNKFLLSKICYAYWVILNNKQDFEDWPEALKMDHFIEHAWKENYE